jgi:penicillin amidase
LNLPRLLLRLFLGRRLPITRGNLTVTGLRDKVTIHRDRWGIPYIEAGSVEDACYGIGFCQGQDRAFQLELLLRVVRGRLAELVGPAGLPVDRLSRRIGLSHSARLQFPLLPEDLRRHIEAYAVGVNAGRTIGLAGRPHELVLLGARPTPWEAVDSIALINLISFTLASNWDVELARLHVLLKDGPEALAALDPSCSGWQPTTWPLGIATGPAVDCLVMDIAAFQAIARSGGGSNNWAVDGSRTRSRRPLLANDPHLSARLPAHWYLVQAKSPVSAVAGASFLGGPVILSGHNGHAAWGVTAALVDNTDLFLEEIGPDGRSVRGPDGWVPCGVREEVITVKRSAAVTETVLVTPRGPIITPAVGAPGVAISLRATWLDARPAEGLMRLPFLQSFEQLHSGIGPWPATAQNVVYADVSGAIGWQIVGQAPRRRQGWGTLPLPGWGSDVGWEEDLVPPQQMPHAVGPSQGFIATANNRPVPDGVGPFLSADWMDGYRIATIQRRLAARSDWDVAATLSLQMNQEAAAWQELRDSVLAVPVADPDSKQAVDLLSRWDGIVAADSPAAGVYELFLSEMVGRVARAKAPNSAAYVLGGRVYPLMPFNFFCYRRTGHLARLLREQPAGWFARPWAAEVADALAMVVRRLRQLQGPATERWAWGALRTLTLEHPLGRGWFLGRVFNLAPIPLGGDHDTINQGAALPLCPLGNADNIASVRVVIDVGAWDNSRFSLPGGQSGNPFSAHYDDLFLLWQRGEGVPIAWAPEEVRAATRETLELQVVRGEW